MLLLKDCARCRGDLLVVTFDGEQTATCLQCGYTRVMTDGRGATGMNAPVLRSKR